MSTHVLAAGPVGDPTTTVSVFVGFVLMTLYVVYRVSNRNATASDYYVAGGNITGAQNGIALAGDWLSAASFLGVAGAIAVHGYDGFLYSVGFLVAWLLELMLIAELVRNTGRFTMGDVIAYRMKPRPVRAAAANTALVISFFYMVAQMASAGGLVALLLVAEPLLGGVAGLVDALVDLVGVLPGHVHELVLESHDHSLPAPIGCPSTLVRGHGVCAADRRAARCSAMRATAGMLIMSARSAARRERILPMRRSRPRPRSITAKMPSAPLRSRIRAGS